MISKNKNVKQTNKFAGPPGVLDHALCSFLRSSFLVSCCLFPVAFQCFLFPVARFTLLLSSIWSRAWPPWGPRPAKVVCRSRRGPLQIAPWTYFPDFLSVWRGIKKTRFFGSAPKRQKSWKSSILEGSRSILGAYFIDFGSHFGVDFSLLSKMTKTSPIL